MKIAILGSRGYPVVYSGYETFVREVASRLAGRGHEITVYCHRHLFAERPAMRDGVRLVYLPTSRRKNLSQLLHTFQASIHACFHRQDALLVINAANGPFGLLFRCCRQRAAVHVDGLEWRRPKWRGLGASYFHWATRMATRHFPRVVTDSVEMGRLIREEFAVEPAVIVYGAEVDLPARHDALEPWGLVPGGYYLIVGRMVPDNNGAWMVAEFLRSSSTRRLVVVGDVPYPDRYADTVKGIADPRLVFPGTVTDPAILAQLYHHSFAYLHGHEYGGTNPSLLQALGGGCAVFALDTVFAREVLDQGQFGLFFAKQEGALTGLIEAAEASPAMLDPFRLRAPGRVQTSYRWDQVTLAYESLFRELAGH